MARYDVYQLSESEFVLDCQADLLSHLNTRLIVPLRRPEDAPPIAKRLNPTFVVGGETLVMVTQFASAIYVRELNQKVGTLADSHFTVMAALDMLITGY